MGYGELLDRYLHAEIRSRRLAQLSATDVQRCINGLSERGLAPRSVRAVHAALRKCLSDAVRIGKVQRNVAKGVALPPLDHREMKSLTPEQAGLLIAALKGSAYAALFTTWIHTGLRPAEIAALKWDDFDGSSLAIRRAFVRVEKTKRAIGPTKTGKPRLIPLGSEGVRVLKEHRRAQVEHRLALGELYRDQGFIFATDYGTPIDFQNIRSRVFKPLLRELGLPDIRLYDLRHTCATLLLAAGENIKVVSERLGHAKVTLTLDTYTHVLPGQQLHASERLECLLKRGGLTDSPPSRLEGVKT